VRHETSPDLDVARGAGTPTRVRAYAVTTLVVALGAGAILVAQGAGLPPVGDLLLLAVPLALCMNRFVFFPNEVGVTADAAVIFAAVVGFRQDAVWLGPLFAALLVGPLDVRHWQERAFVRMTYNSGSTAIVTLAGVAVFVPLSDAWGASLLALLGAGAVAAVAYVLVESVLGVVLVSLQGEPTRAAIRHQLPVNTVAVPLALYGTAAGLLVGAAGWVPAVLVLLPVPLVPELLLVEIPRRWRVPQWATLVEWTVVIGFLVVLAVVLPLPPLAVVAWLLPIAALVGVESRVSERDPVPALSGIGVLAAVVVVRGDARFLAAVGVAIGVVVVAWALVPRPAPRRATVLAVFGALVGAGLYAVVDPSAELSPVSLTMAVLAGLACVAVTDRRRSTATWCTALVAAAAALAQSWRQIGTGGGLVFVVGMVAVLGAVAAWGAPPWRSRVLGRWASPRLLRWRRPALVFASGGAIVAAGLAATASDGARIGWLLAGAVLTQADLAMALVGVRQWRFAPRPRATGAAVLGATAVGVGLSVPSTALPSWGGLVITVAAVALAVWVGWPLSRQARADGVSAGKRGQKTLGQRA
jgi:hypothetical protein